MALAELVSDLTFVENQIHALFWSRSVYERLIRLDGILSEEEIHWLSWNHHRVSIIDIRRLLDRDLRSVSLFNILRSIRDLSGSHRLPSEDKSPSVDEIREDLDQLNRLLPSFETFASKCVAHTDHLGTPARAPLIEVVDAVLRGTPSSFLRYRDLITGVSSAKIGSEITWE